jgi:hypothetical protein
MFVVVGCGMEMNAKDVAVEYLEMYRNKDKKIIQELDDYVKNENLNDNQKQKYKEILEREYSTLMYEVTDERYEGDVAFITMEVTVIDLYKAQKDSASYFNEHQDEFNDEDGEYDKELFMDYKLDMMSKQMETVTYTIDIKVEKDEDTWKVVQLSNESLEKIHGIYNYEE